MSCDAIASAAFLWLAAAAPQPTSPERAPPPAAVAHEPLFADIIQRAAALKAQVEAFRGGGTIPEAFGRDVRALADLDMEGHRLLARRGTDGDLKCILKGIAEDLPGKLAALQGAADASARDAALRDMAYLLNDNVEVITAPPAPPV